MAAVSKRLRKQPDGTYKQTGWQVRYTDADGVPRRRSFARADAAKDFANTVEADKARGVSVDQAGRKMTFKEFAEEWRRVQVHTESTAAHVESRLRIHVYPEIGDRPLQAIRRTHLQALVKSMAGTLKPSTQAVVMKDVGSVFRAAVLDRLIGVSPAIDVTIPEQSDDDEEVVPFTLDEVARLDQAWPEEWKLAGDLGKGAGLRFGEVCGLTLDRINFLKREITIDRQAKYVKGAGVVLAPPKTKASRRVIPVAKELIDAIAAHLAEHPAVAAKVTVIKEKGREAERVVEEAQLLFALPAGALVYSSHFYGVWDATLERAGLPDGTKFHRYRHTYASALIASGCSPKVVQKRCGHSSIKTTFDLYGHLWEGDDDKTREASAKLFNLPIGPKSAQSGDA